jgi:hypothetical protein
MNNSRLTRSAALGLALAALAAPTAAAQQDLRSPDARDAARAAESAQEQPGRDLRSPDARDAARAAELAQDQPGQDLRSPDARDAAEGRGSFNAPDVTVVKVTKPSTSGGGIDWADAGIGAGGVLGLVLLALGSTLAITYRRQSVPGRQTATTG